MTSTADIGLVEHKHHLTLYTEPDENDLKVLVLASVVVS